MEPAKTNENAATNELPSPSLLELAVETLREELGRQRGLTDWSAVDYLLRAFSGSAGPLLDASLVSAILSRIPPTKTIDGMLDVYSRGKMEYHPGVAFHRACRSGDEATMKVLSRSLRDCADDGGGECPYPWILSHGVSTEGMKALLEAYPQGILQPSRYLSSFCPLDFFLMSSEMTSKRSFDANLWNKFKLMLIAAACCEGERFRGECQLKDAAGGFLPVHMILKRILSRHDFLEDAERARHVLWLLDQIRQSDGWVFERESRDGLYPLHFVLGHRCGGSHSDLAASRALVMLLLAACPSSARHPAWGGRLPIHIAIENGWPCHDLLLSLYPEALETRDPATGLLPFQTAAANAGVASGLALDVTFELFRANPMLCAGAAIAPEEDPVEMKIDL